MMWDQLLERAIDRLKANDTIATTFGDDIRMAGTGDLEIPSIEYTILSDIRGELWEPLLIQWDIWTQKAEDNRNIERIVRALFDQRVPTLWDGVMVMSDYVDGSQLATPNRAGFVGRGLRFRLSPLRQQYALPAH
jgi:hypothetical protein